jgi:hypothetical protein
MQNQSNSLMQLRKLATSDVTVVVRVRPISAEEQWTSGEHSDCRAVLTQGSTVALWEHAARTLVNHTEDSVCVHKDTYKYSPCKQYTFDYVFPEASTTREVFARVGYPAVREVLRGVSAVVFAYGQSGSGKTHTLLGQDACLHGKAASDMWQQEQDLGVATMAFQHLLQELHKYDQNHQSNRTDKSITHTVEVSALQIYLDQVCDILTESSNILQIREHTAEPTASRAAGKVCHLHPREKYVPCNDSQDFERVLQRVAAHRVRNSTSMNQRSSRSHLIITFAVRQTTRAHAPGGPKHVQQQVQQDAARGCNNIGNSSNGSINGSNSGNGSKGDSESNNFVHCDVSSSSSSSGSKSSSEQKHRHVSKLILVDLAGNEPDSARNGRENEASLRMEGINVNESLFALGACIRQRAKSSSLDSFGANKSHGRGADRVTAMGARGHKGTYAAAVTETRYSSVARSSDNPNSHALSAGQASCFRAKSLTRLLKEPLLNAKIFFLACCSPAASASAATGQILTYAAMVKRIRTNAEDSTWLLEQSETRFPIKFIEHSLFVENKHIPRSDKAVTVYLHELRVSVVRVMVSHRWLSPSDDPKAAHPDGKENQKHSLLCTLFQRLVQSNWIGSYAVVHWVDFCECVCMHV